MYPRIATEMDKYFKVGLRYSLENRGVKILRNYSNAYYFSAL
jgi:hypothetical protein